MRTSFAHIEVSAQEGRDSWSRFLEAVSLSPPATNDLQQLTLLERAVNALQRSGRTGAVDVPVQVERMPCCGGIRDARSCQQDGTVWHMQLDRSPGSVVHRECGKSILDALKCPKCGAK